MNTQTKSVAIITARGGSKRIPGKNIKNFCGRPIISYSIQAALESRAFSEVMVSTDSEEIAKVAKKYGASVPFFRSKENSNDYATTSDTLVEVINDYKKIGREFEWGCCIYPTAPFVTANKLRLGMKMLVEKGGTVIPVVKFSYPPQRGFIKNGEYIQMREPEHKRTRSQDLDPLYHDAGQFYCFRIDGFMETKDLMEGNIYPLVMSEMEVQDIDDLADWKLAEIKYKMMMDGA